MLQITVKPKAGIPGIRRALRELQKRGGGQVQLETGDYHDWLEIYRDSYETPRKDLSKISKR